MDTGPEHQSVEDFAQYLMDDERGTFTGPEVNAVACASRTSHHKVRAELESYGFKLARRERVRTPRGFNTSSNDRWYGPGSERSHGGSGWEQINGFGGNEG